jgi:hypothetical protein
MKTYLDVGVKIVKKFVELYGGSRVGAQTID